MAIEYKIGGQKKIVISTLSLVNGPPQLPPLDSSTQTYMNKKYVSSPHKIYVHKKPITTNASCSNLLETLFIILEISRGSD